MWTYSAHINCNWVCGVQAEEVRPLDSSEGTTNDSKNTEKRKQQLSKVSITRTAVSQIVLRVLFLLVLLFAVVWL
jgi:hypothetical protein